MSCKKMLKIASRKSKDDRQFPKLFTWADVLKDDRQFPKWFTWEDVLKDDRQFPKWFTWADVLKDDRQFPKWFTWADVLNSCKIRWEVVLYKRTINQDKDRTVCIQLQKIFEITFRLWFIGLGLETTTNRTRFQRANHFTTDAIVTRKY